MNRLVPLRDITVDQSVQARLLIAPAAVELFAAMYREDADATNGRLPPVLLVETAKKQLILADGITRFEAARRSGIDAIPATINQGTLRDAILLNIMENARHGVPLTIAERRRAAQRLLTDSEWRTISDREIGRRCGLDNKTVNSLRREHAPNTLALPRTVHRAGRSFEMKVAKGPSEEIPRTPERRECTRSTIGRLGVIVASSTRSAAARDADNVRKLTDLQDQWKPIPARLDDFSQALDRSDSLIRGRFLKDNPIAAEILGLWRSVAKPQSDLSVRNEHGPAAVDVCNKDLESDRQGHVMN
jgi:hypothetical protein